MHCGISREQLRSDLDSHLCALTHWRWDRYCTYPEAEVTLECDKRLIALFLFEAGIGRKRSYAFEKIFFPCMCLVCV